MEKKYSKKMSTSSTATLFAKVERHRQALEDDLEKLRGPHDEKHVLIKKIDADLISFQNTLNSLDENAVQRETNMDKRALSKEQVS